jgi:hypothetical protein
MTTELATYSDAFSAFQAASSALSGGDQKPILKFHKGDWLLGQESEDVPNGTCLAANLLEAEWGWVRWKDNKPVERRMYRIASGRVPDSRDVLGHNDEALWDRDDNGRPRDPWQRMIEIPARELSGFSREVVLSGGSKGWEGCCKALFGEFGEGLKEGKGDRTPIVKLSGSHYEHKVYGRTKVPVLELVEWRDLAQLLAAPEKKKPATKF